MKFSDKEHKAVHQVVNTLMNGMESANAHTSQIGQPTSVDGPSFESRTFTNNYSLNVRVDHSLDPNTNKRTRRVRGSVIIRTRLESSINVD